MNYNWNWSIFTQLSPDALEPYWVLFVHGAWGTFALSMCAWVIALVVGVSLGVARTTSSIFARALSYLYVQVFRGVPLLVQMFLWYFVLPELIAPLKRWVVETEVAHVQFIIASICLGLFTAARVAEQVRAGIQSLSTGQHAAAIALGLSSTDSYRFVLLPQAITIILPPLTSELMNLIKNSSIAMTIGYAELIFRTKEIAETTFSYFEAFTVATVVYLTIALLAFALMSYLDNKHTQVTP